MIKTRYLFHSLAALAMAVTLSLVMVAPAEAHANTAWDLMDIHEMDFQALHIIEAENIRDVAVIEEDILPHAVPALFPAMSNYITNALLDGLPLTKVGAPVIA